MLPLLWILLKNAKPNNDSTYNENNYNDMFKEAGQHDRQRQRHKHMMHDDLPKTTNPTMLYYTGPIFRI